MGRPILPRAVRERKVRTSKNLSFHPDEKDMTGPASKKRSLFRGNRATNRAIPNRATEDLQLSRMGGTGSTLAQEHCMGGKVERGHTREGSTTAAKTRVWGTGRFREAGQPISRSTETKKQKRTTGVSSDREIKWKGGLNPLSSIREGSKKKGKKQTVLPQAVRNSKDSEKNEETERVKEKTTDHQEDEREKKKRKRRADIVKKKIIMMKKLE